MALKYKCKWCDSGTIDKREVCYNCRVKHKTIKESGIWMKKNKKERYKTRWERTDAFCHELGSETQKLVDFVNKSGTIHYGRVVAKEHGLIGGDVF